ncbi:MAG TPA: DEAD/DEAH box helicase [Candidatus Methanoperedens sp.]|nr:DEAD/DEAH box helicase [Candidatus Methanoperedens sp.]
MQFPQFNLDPRILAGVRAFGWEEPTPIQEQAIPRALEGRDVLGLARTGTGKTAAFLLPILQRLASGPRKGVRALIVAPTRELAEQIHQAATALCRPLGLRSLTLYGGVNINPQTRALRAGVDIVVACPGRLLDHVGQGNVNLSHVEVLVLDEADRMFDMGFMPEVRRIVRHLPAKRQTLLFSATMPQEVRHLVAEVQRDPVTVQVGTLKPTHTVAHALYPVAQHLKTPLLLELLRSTDTGSVIVFTKTKHRAKRVGEQLVKLGHRAASLQGNLSQNRRQEALDGFRQGTYTVLVATDIAARGIDVSQISHVINYDVPDTVDAYTHRIGRTGRLERTGDAFTFVTGEDTAMIRDIERTLGEPIPRKTLAGFDYAAKPPAAAEFRPDRRPGGRPGGRSGRRPAIAHTEGQRGAHRPAPPPTPTRRLTGGAVVCSHIRHGAEGNSRESRGTAARRPQR